MAIDAAGAAGEAVAGAAGGADHPTRGAAPRSASTAAGRRSTWPPATRPATSGRSPPPSQAAELIDPAGLGGHYWLVQPVGVAGRRAPGRAAALTTGPMAGRERWRHAAPSWSVGTGDRARADRHGPQHRRRSTRPPTACCGCGWSLDGDRVVTAEPIVGYMHRGAEKLFEVRDYRQIIVLANRHDWLSAFANELGVALAVERLHGHGGAGAGGLAAHRAGRAQPGAQPPDVPRLVPGRARRGHAGRLRASRDRETLQAVMEEVSGGRMHYMFNRVGGLKEEVPGRLDRPGPGRHRRGARAACPSWTG